MHLARRSFDTTCMYYYVISLNSHTISIVVWYKIITFPNVYIVVLKVYGTYACRHNCGKRTSPIYTNYGNAKDTIIPPTIIITIIFFLGGYISLEARHSTPTNKETKLCRPLSKEFWRYYIWRFFHSFGWLNWSSRCAVRIETELFIYAENL